MNYTFLCLSVFSGSYLLNIFYITVLYHRGLAHGSVKLAPRMRAFAVATGSWVTGIDPKAWACMHRLHHRYSDSARDPHSPWNGGVFGVMIEQLKSYERVIRALGRPEHEYQEQVIDLDFPVNWMNRHRLWWLPYAVHAVIAVAVGFFFHAWILGGAFWLGMMSHPIQGWLVNSFAHKFGYRNFATPDESRNNSIVAWLVMGEGYQNNHHARPLSAKFSMRWYEFDGGYVMARMAEAAGMLQIDEKQISRQPVGLAADAVARLRIRHLA